MLYKGLPSRHTLFRPTAVNRVESHILDDAVCEYEQTLRLLAICKNEHAHRMRYWLSEAVAFLEAELSSRERTYEPKGSTME